jgi:hypothetical protein
LQVLKEPGAKDVHAIFLSAYYCNNVDSRRTNSAVEAIIARINKLIHMHAHLLRPFGTLLQPDDFMLLVQWMLRTGCADGLTIFLACTLPVVLKPPT